MANAIIGGLVSAGVSPKGIFVSDPYEPSRRNLEKSYGVHTTDRNNDLVTSEGTILVLAVKPQVMKAVAEGIAAQVARFKPLVVSIAAGVNVDDLATWLSPSLNLNPSASAGAGAGAESTSPSRPAIIRCMPNTPSLVSEGATGLYATQQVSQAQKDDAYKVMSSVSKVYWVDSESLIDAVTGVSGSGPAYFFLIVEALENAGIEMGLPRDVAQGLAAQTCLGAGKMLTTSPDSAAELRRKVTSPNGTTHAAIESLEGDKIREIVARAGKAAYDRGQELGKILGAQGSKM